MFHVYTQKAKGRGKGDGVALPQGSNPKLRGESPSARAANYENNAGFMILVTFWSKLFF